MEAKYVVKCFESKSESVEGRGVFVGYLAYFDALGVKSFSPDLEKAIQFDKLEDCVVSDREIWESDNGFSGGWYEIKQVDFVFSDREINNVLELFSKLNNGQKEQFKKMII